MKLQKNSFFILSSFLLFCLYCLPSELLAGGTSAGVIVSTSGNVKAVGNNNTRTLQRGDSFYVADTIVTEPSSNANLKFSDDAVVHLTEDTQFRVDTYHFKESSSSDTSVTSLLKGGFQAISGSIGQENPSNVQINTPVATIGIRGTALECALAGEELFLSCTQGNIEVRNSWGTVTIGEGRDQFANVSASRPPMSLPERPEILLPGRFFRSQIEALHPRPLPPRPLPPARDHSLQGHLPTDAKPKTLPSRT